MHVVWELRLSSVLALVWSALVASVGSCTVSRGQASDCRVVTTTQLPPFMQGEAATWKGSSWKDKNTVPLSEQSTTRTSLFRLISTEFILTNWWALSFLGHLHLVYLKYLISLTLRSCLIAFSRASPRACPSFTRQDHTIRAISVVLCSLAGFMEVFWVANVTNTCIIYFITFWTDWERKQECVPWLKSSMRRHVSSFYLSQEYIIYRYVILFSSNK